MSRKLYYLFFVITLLVVAVIFVCIPMLDSHTDSFHHFRHFSLISNIVWNSQQINVPASNLLLEDTDDVCSKLCNADYFKKLMVITKNKLTSPFSDADNLSVNVEDERATTITRGYMFALRYYEQQTEATRTLLQMQCFASSFGATIVEPFLYKSTFSFRFQDFSPSIEPTDQFLTLTDLMDTELWNREAIKMYGYHPISSWKDFIEHAPRKVIIHCIRYHTSSSLPEIYMSQQEHSFRAVCPKNCSKQFDKSLSYLSRYGFKMVRVSCSDFLSTSEAVTTSDFMENILGSYKANEVTVLMNQFRGFFGFSRLPVLSECGIRHHSLGDITVIPSVRIKTDAQKYTEEVFNNRPYVAILARIERLVSKQHKEIRQCAKELQSVLNKLKSSHKTLDTFLAMDVGKFGSSGAAVKHLQPNGEMLFQSIYKEKWSFAEWEETFERIAWSNNSAYIANLQRTIAAGGDCLVMVGGGSFQEQARKLYEKFHPDSSSWCIFRVSNQEDVL